MWSMLSARAIARALARNDKWIKHFGYRPRAKVLEIIAAQDFLVSPSEMEIDVREKFGTAVAEDLGSQHSVREAKGLAWGDLESEGAVLRFDPNAEMFTVTLKRMCTIDEQGYQVLAQGARRYAEARLDLAGQGNKLMVSLIDNVSPVR